MLQQITNTAKNKFPGSMTQNGYFICKAEKESVAVATETDGNAADDDCPCNLMIACDFAL